MPDRLALIALLAQWRGMVANAFAEGPIHGDEAGHIARWTAVEMCADELEAFLSQHRLAGHIWKDGHWNTIETDE